MKEQKDTQILENAESETSIDVLHLEGSDHRK